MDDAAVPAIKINYVSQDFGVAEFDNADWRLASQVTVTNYWSGESAPEGRHFTAGLLWSATAIYVRFEANQNEDLVISDKPKLESKTRGLWDQDVCEIFIAPERDEGRKYFEFEIAPSGEWIDLAIDLSSGKRETDWDYASGMTAAAKVERGRVVMAIKIPWIALGNPPKVGDIWLGNLFRCVGAGPMRGYLAWQPTETEQPNFHVPSKFGEFEFTK